MDSQWRRRMISEGDITPANESDSRISLGDKLSLKIGSTVACQAAYRGLLVIKATSDAQKVHLHIRLSKLAWFPFLQLIAFARKTQMNMYWFLLAHKIPGWNGLCLKDSVPWWCTFTVFWMKVSTDVSIRQVLSFQPLNHEDSCMLSNRKITKISKYAQAFVLGSHVRWNFIEFFSRSNEASFIWIINVSNI